MESLPHLPEGLVILIMESLPLASAIRFQSVCKSWRSIISAPGFLQRSILLPRKRRETSLVIAEARRDDDVGLLIEPSYTVLESPTFLSPTEFGPLPPKRDFLSSSVVVVGSCRGVVCLAESGSELCVLWNPTTGELRALRDDDRDQVDERFFCSLGFGHYDGDFKVVKIFKTRRKFDDPIQIRAKIYKLRLGYWREISPAGIGNDDIRLSYFSDRHMVCWRDGKTCLWITSNWKVGCDNRKRECSCIIVSFDMANETFTNFSSPPLPLYFDGIGLLALNDRLALWCCHSHHRHQRDEISMDIWVLLQHGVVESWAKLWTIRVGPEPHWPMEIWNGGLVMTCGSEDRLVWCDLSSSPQSHQTLPDFASPSCSWRVTTKVVAFEKTHASLDSDRTTLTLQVAKRKNRS